MDDLLYGEGAVGKLVKLLRSLPGRAKLPDSNEEELKAFLDGWDTRIEWGKEAERLLTKVFGKDGLAALYSENSRATPKNIRKDARKEQLSLFIKQQQYRYEDYMELRASLIELHANALEMLESDEGRRELAMLRAEEHRRELEAERASAAEELLAIVVQSLEAGNDGFFKTFEEAAKKAIKAGEKEELRGPPPVQTVRLLAERFKSLRGRWPSMKELIEEVEAEGFYAEEGDRNRISAGMSAKVKNAGLAGHVKGERGASRKT